MAGTVAGTVAAPVIAQMLPASLHEAARIAALHLLPMQTLYALRHADTLETGERAAMPLNRLTRDRDDGELLEFRAWLDLAQEPLFLSLPIMGRRFYDIALHAMTGAIAAHVSARRFGPASAPQMIVGPFWDGSRPRGLGLLRAPGNSLLLIGRIERLEGDDPGLATLRRGVLLETPDMRNERRMVEMRELIRQRTEPPPEAIADWPPPEPGDPFDLLQIAARELAQLAPPSFGAGFVEACAQLRLRPGRRWDRRGFSPHQQSEIAAGIAVARDSAARAPAAVARRVAGWRWLPPIEGSDNDGMLQRLARASTAIDAPDAVETLVAEAAHDASGQRLDGAVSYSIDLNAAAPLSTRDFWSITAIGADGTTAGPSLVRRSDDSARWMRLDLGSGATGSSDAGPATARIALPAGAFRLVWRIHAPAEDLIAGRIGPPPLQRRT